MRRLATLPLVLLAACHGHASTGGGTDAGPAAARDVAMPGTPHAVSLDGPDDVEVVRGPYAIHASGPQAILDRLTFETRDGVLHVDRKPGISFNETSDVTIRVSLPAIDAAAITGSGDLSVDRTDGKAFAAALHGSGDLKVERVGVDALAVDAGGSGEFSASGTARTIDASVSGSGDVDLSDVTSDAATVSLTGSSGLKLGDTKRVTGAVSGSGDLDVAGHPACTVAKSGSGEVTCG